MLMVASCFIPISLLVSALTTKGSKEDRRTLTEKLSPKPRKTEVDDMLETPDYPSIGRVMRARPHPDEKPASGFSWGDYEDVHIDQDVVSGAGGVEG